LLKDPQHLRNLMPTPSSDLLIRLVPGPSLNAETGISI
jgi:hypothetical protein